MITDNNLQFLEKLLSGEITKEDNPKRYSETMIRIQEFIDKGIAKTLILAEKFPEILKDEAREINDPSLERYRRFKAFAYIVSLLNPATELEKIGLPDILKKLSLLYPKYYFKIIRKDKDTNNQG